MKHLRFWCMKVLPCVYDDSLSYYEVLCKIVKYINDLIEQDKLFVNEIEECKAICEELQKWIDNFDDSYIKEIVDSYIATMIFVHINEGGYITYYVPEKWHDIIFRTTGLDIEIEDKVSHENVEYGHLVLEY